MSQNYGRSRLKSFSFQGLNSWGATSCQMYREYKLCFTYHGWKVRQFTLEVNRLALNTPGIVSELCSLEGSLSHYMTVCCGTAHFQLIYVLCGLRSLCAAMMLWPVAQLITVWVLVYTHTSRKTCSLWHKAVLYYPKCHPAVQSSQGNVIIQVSYCVG